MDTPRTGSRILLDFGTFQLPARLFDTRIAREFFNLLPKGIELIAWGEEVYGTIGADLGNDNPQADIPPGGIAYSTRGTYLCIFFGQQPAWPVEFIGTIEGEGWQRLKDEEIRNVTVLPQPLRFASESPEGGAVLPGAGEGDVSESEQQGD